SPSVPSVSLPTVVPTPDGPAPSGIGSGFHVSFPTRRRSTNPRWAAKPSTTTSPTTSDGIIGTNTSDGDNPSALAARTVGPPHGMMFIVAFASPATTVRTTGL